MSKENAAKDYAFYLKSPTRVLSFILVVNLFLLSSCGLNQSNPQLNSNQGNIKIVGGSPVTDQDSFIYKTTAALYRATSDFFCSATVIDPNWIVTAGHCIDAVAQEPIRVVVGNSTTSGNPITRTASGNNQVLHPEYQLVLLENTSTIIKEDLTQTEPPNDIALVKLDSPFPDTVAIAKIPTYEQFDITSKTPITLAGFGDTKVEGGFGGLTTTNSGRLYNVDIPLDHANLVSKELYLGPEYSKSACHGDSGGPAFYKDEQGNFWLIGATSRGLPGEGAVECFKIVNVYTDLRGFNSWITETIQQL